jgi:hypothetical protein
MILKEDIDNVRLIIEKTKQVASTEQERQKYDNLIKSLDDAANRYLKEVKNNGRLQLYN